MADNITVDISSGTAVIATDDIASVHYQKIKLFDGTADSLNFAKVDGAGALAIADNGGSLTVDGTVAVSTGPAAARTTDSIAASFATDAIMNGLTAVAPNFTGVTASASGATTIVSAVSLKKIRVLGFFVVTAAAVSVQLRSHTTTATATGALPFGANGGITLPFSPIGWFETAVGEALDINLGAALAVGGGVVYAAVT